jgi:hypothetical protein
MLSTLILGLLAMPAAPAPVSLSCSAIAPCSAQTSNARTAFRSDFDQRVARIRTDLAVHGNVQLQALQDLARDMAVAAEAAELENLWLELILLAESVADQRGDRELALRWLDPANAEHPVIAATGELKSDRVALLAQAKQQVAGRPELKARLASWGPTAKLEPLFSFEQAWERTSRVYGSYEGSLSQLRSKFESVDGSQPMPSASEWSDLRDAAGLYYLVLESLGRNRTWPYESPLVALNHVDSATAEALVGELLFCGYPEWTRQLLDLWLSNDVKPWQRAYRGNLMAGLLDDPLGRRAVQPSLASNLQLGQFSEALLQRLPILIEEDPGLLEVLYGGSQGVQPMSNPLHFFAEYEPITRLALQHPDREVQVNAAVEYARYPDPRAWWERLDPRDSELHRTFVTSIKRQALTRLEPKSSDGSVLSSIDVWRTAADPNRVPILSKLLPACVAAMSVEDLKWSLGRLADSEEEGPLALQALNATVARDDFAEWTRTFDHVFEKLIAWELVPDLALAERRYAEPSKEKDFEAHDFNRVLEELTSRETPEHLAWAVEIARQYDYPLERTWVVQDLARAGHRDAGFLKHLVHLARGLSGHIDMGGSLFLQLEGAAGAALREVAFAPGLTADERLTAWCLGWDPMSSPDQFMQLVQRPGMVVAFQEHRANSAQGTIQTTGRGGTAYVLRLDQVQDSISRWYRDGRHCEDEARVAFHRALLGQVREVDPRTLLLVSWKDNRELGPDLSTAALQRLLDTPYEDDSTARACKDITQVSLENLRKYATERLTDELILKLLDDPFTVGSTISELQQMPTREAWLRPLADLIREDSAIGRAPYMNEAGRDRVRVQIVQLLERLNSLEAAQVLLEFDQFQNTTLSKEVNAALSRMRERFATREAFANWNNQQRQRAQTIGGLAALLDAEEPDQRVAAIQSLGALAAQEYLPDLIVLFADEDPSVAAAARKAVHSIQDALERVPGSKPDESRGEAPEGDSE